MTEPQRRWVVKIEGGRHFKDGWQEFCLHHNLKVGDFLVFTYQTDFLFHVSVFDPATACQRHYPPSSHQHHLNGVKGFPFLLYMIICSKLLLVKVVHRDCERTL